jgi:GNAT superfamily N-acetyltransferase
MRIERLTTFDDQTAGRWFDAYSAGASAGRVAPLITSRDRQLASLAADATNPNRHREAWGAWDGGPCLGVLLAEWPRRENRHLAEIEVDVPPAHRGRGAGAALWATGCEQARAAGRTTLNVELNVPLGVPLEDWPGGRFALARGYVAGHAECRLVLDLPMPADRLAGLDVPVPGYRALSFDGPMPAEWLAPLAGLVNGMAADVPIGELDLEAARWDAIRVGDNQHRMCALGYGLLTTLVIDPAGAAVAYTQMLASGDDVQQEDTYVRPAARGHRLGALAKARNLRALAAVRPGARHVHTWTAEVNDPMRRINESFGFRPVERLYALEAPVPRWRCVITTR